MLAQQYLYANWREFGFQVYGVSPDVPEALLPELFRMIKYTAPVDLPNTSDPAEISKLYPEMYRYGRVGDMLCVAHSNYIGQDASLRYGNYIGHALLLRGVPPFRPVDLMGGAIWKRSLTPQEQKAERGPQVLPTIDVLPDRVIGWDALSEFLADLRNESDYKRIMNAFLYAKRNRLKFYLHDRKERLPYWFALVQYSLPVSLAWQMSFSTYVFDFLERSLDMGAVPATGCYLDYAAEKRNRRMVVMDLEHDVCTTDIPELSVVEFLCFGISLVRDQLEDFQGFLESLQLERPLLVLQECYSLYRLMRPCKDSPSTRELLAAQELLTSLSDETLKNRLYDGIFQRLDSLIARDEEGFQLLTTLLRGAPACADALFEKTSAIYMRARCQESDPAFAARLEAFFAGPSFPRRAAYAEYVLSDTSVMDMLPALEEFQGGLDDRAHLLAYFAALPAVGQQRNKDMLLSSISGKTLDFEDCARALPILLPALSGSPEATTRLISRALTGDDSARRAAQDALNGLYNTLDAATLDKLEGVLLQTPQTATFALYCMLTRTPERDRPRQFWKAYPALSATVTDNASLNAVLAEYLKTIPEKQQIEETELILTRTRVTPEPDLLQTLAGIYAREPVDQLLGRRAASMKALFLCIVQQGGAIHGKLLCVQCALALADAQPTDLAALLNGYAVNPESLGRGEYEPWLDAMLEGGAPRARCSGDALLLLQKCACIGKEDALGKKLGTFLRGAKGNMGMLLIPMLTSSERPYPLDHLTSELITAYARIDEKRMQKMLQLSGIPAAQLQTSPFLMEVTRTRENSLSGRIRSLFTRKG